VARLPSDAVWKFFAALAVIGLAANLWVVVCTTPGIYWNPPRLASAFALARGLELYPAPDSGAQLGWFYPPGFAIWYLPITIFENPTAIAVAAAALNLGTITAPIMWLARIAKASWPAAMAATLTVLTLWLAHQSTHGAFFSIHIDAVCVACGLIAAGATWRAACTRSNQWLHIAALAAVGAMFTKQLAIVLPLACAAWLIRSGHYRGAFRLLCWVAIYGSAAALAVMLRWGPEATINAIALIHMQTPYVGADGLLLQTFQALIIDLPLWALVAFLLWRTTRDEPRAPTPTLGSVLIWIAVAHLPLGLLAPLKVGGNLNSLHTLHYLAAAFAVGAARTWDAPADSPRRTHHVRIILSACWCLGMILGLKHSQAHAYSWQLDRGQDAVLAKARERHGSVYLPWNPLITILADNKIYPFDNALFCLEIARMAPPGDAVRAAIPRGAMIMYPEPAQSKIALTYLFPPTVSAPRVHDARRTPDRPGP
jgi:hypothetical protein